MAQVYEFVFTTVGSRSHIEVVDGQGNTFVIDFDYAGRVQIRKKWDDEGVENIAVIPKTGNKILIQ